MEFGNCFCFKSFSTSGTGGHSRSRATSNALEASHSYENAVRKRQHVRRTHRNYRMNYRATSTASTGDEGGDGDGDGERQRAVDQVDNMVDDNVANVAEDNSENANAGRVEERLATVNEVIHLHLMFARVMKYFLNCFFL